MDGTVIVADGLEGKPLGANGPLQLVATGEKRAGAVGAGTWWAIHVMTAR